MNQEERTYRQQPCPPLIPNTALPTIPNMCTKATHFHRTNVILAPQGFDMSSRLPAIHFRAPMRGRSGHRLDSALSDLDLSPCLLDALKKTVN
jgi:hypothetical protein